MTEPLRRQLRQAAQGPSGPVDLAHIEARSRRLRRRARRTTGSILATVLAVAVIGVVAVSSGDSPPARVTTTQPAAGPIAQMTVRDEVEAHMAALLAPTQAELARRAHGASAAGSFLDPCKETTYATYLQASGTAPGTASQFATAGSTPVYVCDASNSLVPPDGPISSVSVLYVATVASYAELLSGQGGVPVALVDQPSSGGFSSEPAWFTHLVDQPGLSVAGVTSHSAPPPAPPRSPSDRRYVAPTYVGSTALEHLQCPVPPHLSGVRDTNLPATSPALVDFGASTCTTATVQLFASHAAAESALHQVFGSGSDTPTAAVYIVTVRGRLDPVAGRLAPPDLEGFYTEQDISEFDARDGRLAGGPGGNTGSLSTRTGISNLRIFPPRSTVRPRRPSLQDPPSKPTSFPVAGQRPAWWGRRAVGSVVSYQAVTVSGLGPG